MSWRPLPDGESRIRSCIYGSDTVGTLWYLPVLFQSETWVVDVEAVDWSRIASSSSSFFVIRTCCLSNNSPSCCSIRASSSLTSLSSTWGSRKCSNGKILTRKLSCRRSTRRPSWCMRGGWAWRDVVRSLACVLGGRGGGGGSRVRVTLFFHLFPYRQIFSPLNVSTRTVKISNCEQTCHFISNKLCLQLFSEPVCFWCWLHDPTASHTVDILPSLLWNLPLFCADDTWWDGLLLLSCNVATVSCSFCRTLEWYVWTISP